MTFRAQDIKYLINDHGQTLTLGIKGSPTYDPLTGDVSSSDDTYSVKVYMSNYSITDINGQDIIVGDRRALMPPTDTTGSLIPEPEPGDTISGEGDTVSIVSVSTIMSGTLVMCYQCQVRE